MEGQQFKASADIAPSRFVSISGDNEVETAGAGAIAIGIMHESEWHTPIPGAATGVAVPAGQSKRVYQAGETCSVVVGTGGLTAGQRVMSDAAGAGVAATATNEACAICLEGGAAGALAKVKVTDPVPL